MVIVDGKKLAQRVEALKEQRKELHAKEVNLSIRVHPDPGEQEARLERVQQELVTLSEELDIATGASKLTAAWTRLEVAHANVKHAEQEVAEVREQYRILAMNVEG